MDDLFTNLHNHLKPLAEKMRPTSLDDFVGQRHILGEGKLLRRLISQKSTKLYFLWTARDRENYTSENYC